MQLLISVVVGAKGRKTWRGVRLKKSEQAGKVMTSISEGPIIDYVLRIINLSFFQGPQPNKAPSSLHSLGTKHCIKTRHTDV